jgi:hypothetical protein
MSSPFGAFAAPRLDVVDSRLLLKPLSNASGLCRGLKGRLEFGKFHEIFTKLKNRFFNL